jgi:hypothetical protein
MGQLPHLRAHTESVPGGQLVAGRAALEAGRWAEARVAFESVLVAEAPEGGAPEALGRAGGLRRPLGPVRQRGGRVRLARPRADRVPRRRAAGPRGLVLAARGYLCTDHEAAYPLIRRALEQGRRMGDVDLERSALSGLGGRLVHAGRAAEGLGLIDQAMAGTLGGECRRLQTVVWAACTMLEPARRPAMSAGRRSGCGWWTTSPLGTAARSCTPHAAPTMAVYSSRRAAGPTPSGSWPPPSGWPAAPGRCRTPWHWPDWLTSGSGRAGWRRRRDWPRSATTRCSPRNCSSPGASRRPPWPGCRPAWAPACPRRSSRPCSPDWSRRCSRWPARMRPSRHWSG